MMATQATDRILNSRVLLKTLVAVLPLWILASFSNYIIWLFAGFELGVVPTIDQLSTVTIIIWQVVSVLRWGFYLGYGGLYTWFATRQNGGITLREAVGGGSAVGLLTSSMSRLLHTITTVTGDNALFVLAPPSPAGVDRASTFYMWGAICGLGLYIAAATVLSTLGAVVTMSIKKK